MKHFLLQSNVAMLLGKMRYLWRFLVGYSTIHVNVGQPCGQTDPRMTRVVITLSDTVSRALCRDVPKPK